MATATPAARPQHISAAKPLLACGIAASLLYVAMNIVVPMQYPGYISANLTVSDLSAIGTPMRTLWVVLAFIYSLLLMAFGYGLWLSGRQNRPLRITGILLIVEAVIGLFWPPMHQREVIAAGGATISDTLHIVFTVIWTILIVAAICFSAAAFGKRFKIYAIATLAAMLVFGILTSLGAGNIQNNLPTPLIGLWERLNIGAFLLWLALLAVVSMTSERKTADAG